MMTELKNKQHVRSRVADFHELWQHGKSPCCEMLWENHPSKNKDFFLLPTTITTEKEAMTKLLGPSSSESKTMWFFRFSSWASRVPGKWLVLTSSHTSWERCYTSCGQGYVFQTSWKKSSSNRWVACFMSCLLVSSCKSTSSLKRGQQFRHHQQAQAPVVWSMVIQPSGLTTEYSMTELVP